MAPPITPSYNAVPTLRNEIGLSKVISEHSGQSNIQFGSNWRLLRLSRNASNNCKL